MLEYMTIGRHYFCSKWYTAAQAMTLHGSAASGLKNTTHLHCYRNIFHKYNQFLLRLFIFM